MSDPKRNTAFKLWISDIISKEFIKGEGEWDSSYIEIKNKKISRVNIIATVVAKYSNETNKFSSLTIDDGSSQIRLKTWGEDSKIFSNIEVGDIILTIGRIRKYDQEMYITPELVRKLDNLNWELLRKLELIKEHGTPKQPKVKVEQEKEVAVEQTQDATTENDRQKVLTAIEKLDSIEGVDRAKIIYESEVGKQKTELILQELLIEGEIYEVEQDKFRITE